MPDFYPPKQIPVLVRFTQSVSPLIAHWRHRMNLRIAPESLERLAALRDSRLLLLSNHPTHYDWIAVFLLSARLGELFHYLAAYERFGSTEGWFLQHMGAYSVRRGLGDRPSVAQTIELLMQPQARLVVFPEGGFSFQNDTVMPFRSGAIQLALQAMTKRVRQGEPVPDLYTVPVSLKYRYRGDMLPVIDSTLQRLEKSLDLHPQDADFYTRLLAVADRVLGLYGQDYDLTPEKTTSLSRNDLIQYIKDSALLFCEQTLDISSNPAEPLRERVYRIQRVLESQAEQLGETNPQIYDRISTAASRLLNFNAIYDGYVAASPTPERFLDTLVRLERAVFGIDQPPPKGDRDVIIHIGNPINLKDHFNRYQQDRAATVEDLTQQLRQQVQDGLDLINANWHS